MTTVSVVVPAFNRGRTIRQALRSVLAQDPPPLEVVVVDDGSADDTRDVVRSCAARDARVLLVSHEERKGAQAARNTGIRYAGGEWVAFLDSDDEWLPGSVSVRLAAAARDDADVVYSECLVVRRAGGVPVRFGVPGMSGAVYEALLRGPAPMFQGLLVRRSALARIGPLDEAITSYQEWDTSIRLALHSRFAFVPEPTFLYHCHGSDTISGDRLRDARGYEQVFTKHGADIVRLLGRGALAQHYENAALLYRTAGDLRDFRRCVREAVRHGTLGRTLLRRLALLLGMGRGSQAG